VQKYGFYFKQPSFWVEKMPKMKKDAEKFGYLEK